LTLPTLKRFASNAATLIPEVRTLRTKVQELIASHAALAEQLDIVRRERENLEGKLGREESLRLQEITLRQELLTQAQLREVTLQQQAQLRENAISQGFSQQIANLAQLTQANTDRLLSKIAAVDYRHSLSRNRAAVEVAGRDGALYLDLMEAVLTGMISEDAPTRTNWNDGAFDEETRLLGRDWPSRAYTMIGAVRMRNLRDLLEVAIADRIPGDFIETGVWRGGACIYARAIFQAYDIKDRIVWVADSFQGLPPPDAETFPADAGDPHHMFPELAVSADTVQRNFARFGLLDEQVTFLEGWFKDTLPGAPIERLAVLRLDADMYESTIEALEALYPKMSPNGFVIVDDYILPACRQAVDDFRKASGITASLEEVDGAAVYWRVPGDGVAAEKGRRGNDG